MILSGNLFKSSLCITATAVLMAVGTTSALAQQGVVSDWSTQHVIFSSPGSEMDALMHGERQEWQLIVDSPRYQMQQIRRSAAWANRLANATPQFMAADASRGETKSAGKKATSMQRDWAVQIAPAGSGTALGAFPAKYGFYPNTASCSDYVVFPVDSAGASGTGTGQANLVAFNNLYKTTCNSGTPTILFSYYIGTGTVQTSPVLSEDGTKIAFVESLSTGSKLHVLTLDTSGSGNGSAYNSPAVPHTINDNGTIVTTAGTNNATDTYVTLNGSPMVTRSSPFVDYTNDVAYVGDDNGFLHKFTGVFRGTLAEVTTGGWPFSVAASGTALTGPVFDSVSKNIFIAGAGNLYCVVSATPAPCSTPSVNVSNGSVSSGAPLDGPIVDSTAGTVFSEAVATNATTTESILMQANTSLGNVVRATMGTGGTDLRNGTFDSTYLNSTPGAYSGYMYFCGNNNSAATPTLYRIGFSSAGVMNSTRDTSSYQLVTTGDTGTTVSCTPLTEINNGTTDYLFLGVRSNGAPSGCAGQACVMSFVIGTSAGPVAAIPNSTADFPLGGNGSGSSGIVIDNTTTITGTSQIYFANLQTGNATQASQAGLQ